MGKSLSYEYDLNQSKLLNINIFHSVKSINFEQLHECVEPGWFHHSKKSRNFQNSAFKATIHQFKVINYYKSFYECLLDGFFHFLKPL